MSDVTSEYIDLSASRAGKFLNKEIENLDLIVRRGFGSGVLVIGVGIGLFVEAALKHDSSGIAIGTISTVLGAMKLAKEGIAYDVSLRDLDRKLPLSQNETLGPN